MITSQSAVTLCGWGVKEGVAHSSCEQTSGWLVKVCDSSLTRAMPELLRDEQLIIKRYTNKASYTYILFCILLQTYKTFTYLARADVSAGNSPSNWLHFCVTPYIY